MFSLKSKEGMANPNSKFKSKELRIRWSILKVYLGSFEDKVYLGFITGSKSKVNPKSNLGSNVRLKSMVKDKWDQKVT